MNLKRSKCRGASGARKSAFTLIELLVVIAIIGFLAAMVANLAGGASDTRKRKMIEAQNAKLVTAIENYKAKWGFYPPDNSNNVANVGLPAYNQSTAINPLFYELIGASIVQDASGAPQKYQLLNGTNVFPGDLAAVFGRAGLANATPVNSADQQATSYLTPLPKPNEIKAYAGMGNGQPIYGLVVPVSLDRDPANPTNSLPANFINFWHYDSSSASRHNMDGFDVWAVYSSGKNIITNGNWIHQ